MVKIQLFIAYLAEDTTCQTYKPISMTAVTEQKTGVCVCLLPTAAPAPPPQQQQHSRCVINWWLVRN